MSLLALGAGIGGLGNAFGKLRKTGYGKGLWEMVPGGFHMFLAALSTLAALTHRRISSPYGSAMQAPMATARPPR